MYLALLTFLYSTALPDNSCCCSLNCLICLGVMMDCTETLHIPALSLLGKSCPFRNVSINLSCSNEFASLRHLASLGYIFELVPGTPQLGLLLWESVACLLLADTLQLWVLSGTCELKANPATKDEWLRAPSCFIIHGSCKSLKDFVSSILFMALRNWCLEENRGDMIYWSFNIQVCLQDLFAVNPCSFFLHSIIL